MAEALPAPPAGPRRGRALNLGCGRLLFPTPEMAAAEPDLAWWNVDRLPLPGVQETLDLFSFPWPWESASVAHIYAGHLVEHLPHQWPLHVERANQLIARGGDPRWPARLALLDGFFAFFAECWRLLQLGGTVECEVPFGFSTGAIQDPTHTRALVPATLAYLCRQPEASTFDYQLPFQFDLMALTFVPEQAFAGMSQDAIGMLSQHLLNVIRTMRFTLRKGEA